MVLIEQSIPIPEILLGFFIKINLAHAFHYPNVTDRKHPTPFPNNIASISCFRIPRALRWMDEWGGSSFPEDVFRVLDVNPGVLNLR
jgi:hypothetical protein